MILLLKKYTNFIGFVTSAESKNYPAPNFPKNEYLKLADIEKLISNGMHLVITADLFLCLVNFFGINKIWNWQDRIHISKIIDWLLDKIR